MLVAGLWATLACGAASAQWLEDDDRPPPFGRRAFPDLDEGLVAPQRVMRWVARQGYPEVTRPRLVGRVYLVDGIAADGSRVRFVINALDGEVIESRPVRSALEARPFEARPLEARPLEARPFEARPFDDFGRDRSDPLDPPRQRDTLPVEPQPAKPTTPLPSAPLSSAPLPSTRPARPKPEAGPRVKPPPAVQAKPSSEEKPSAPAPTPPTPSAAEAKPATAAPAQSAPAGPPAAPASTPAAPAPAVETKPQQAAGDAKPETTAKAPGPHGPVRVIEGVTPVIPKDEKADATDSGSPAAKPPGAPQ